MPQNIYNLRMISFYGPAWDLIGLPAVKGKGKTLPVSDMVPVPVFTLWESLRN